MAAARVDARLRPPRRRASGRPALLDLQVQFFGGTVAGMMQSRLENKTALVTGATSNIGRAIAVGFAAQGAHVVASGRSPQRGAELIEGIKAAGGRAEFVAKDLDG